MGGTHCSGRVASFDFLAAMIHDDFRGPLGYLSAEYLQCDFHSPVLIVEESRSHPYRTENMKDVIILHGEEPIHKIGIFFLLPTGNGWAPTKSNK